MKSFIRKSFSFRSYAAIGLALVVFAVSGWMFYRDAISEDNVQKYHQLIASANPINSNMKASPYTASQQRQGIQKDVYFFHDGQRLQTRLRSSDSTMVLDNQEEGLEIIEKMQNVKGAMQEELYYLLPDGREVVHLADGMDLSGKDAWIPMQRVRYMEADFATYYYNSEKLMADGVKIYSYIMPSHKLPDSFNEAKPVMTGTARSIECSLAGRSMAFRADELQLSHHIGTLVSDEAQILPHPEEKKMEKGILQLNGHVNINLKEGGCLSCAKACLDFHSGLGVFEGDGSQPEVVYFENCKDRSKPASSTPLLLKSRKMTVELSKDTPNKKSPPAGYLSKIMAEQEVFIDYNRDFIARADTASFDKEKKPADPSKGYLAGLIHLKANGNEGVCQITNRNGDLIKATNICINTATKEMDFAYPKGVFMAYRSDSKGEPIDFKADTLTWDEGKQLLSLKDHVSLEQKGFFSLQNENQINIAQAYVNNKKQIQSIHSEGKTVVTGFEPETDKEHHLTCYGKTTVDHGRLWVYMESPVDAAGNVIEDQQVFFEDDLGQIYADKLSLQYRLENKSITPKKLILEGHVKMLNSYAAGPDPTSPLIRYALADKVEYDLPAKEALFSSNNQRKRVLFYDKANDLEVSAVRLKIKRDEITKKETIKGIGDVRFSFIENEFEQLRRHFALEKLKDKNKDVTK